MESTRKHPARQRKTPMPEDKKQHKKPVGQTPDGSGDKPSKPDIIAIELRRARETKGLSHSDLNRITGISRSVLFGYEAGRTKPGAKEIRLLAEALQVNPNRLLFGTDEPFKPRTGLRALVKLHRSPVMLMFSTFIMPMIFASLDDDQVESILTLLASLVEARDKDAYNKLSALSEVIAEVYGNGTPEELSVMAARANDKDFIEAINKKVEEKLKNMS